MKHGRRHDSLKERVYRERFRQDAAGYARPYEAIDVREPESPRAPPERARPLGVALPAKARRALKRQGIDPDAPPDGDA